MFSFTKEQKIFEISGIKIGGQPGNFPTVLFGGLFSKGKPKFSYSENKFRKIFELSVKLGNPIIPDIFIKNEEYIDSIIDFIENSIPNNIPFSIDIIDPKIKIKVLKILKNKNLLQRTIYNSIHVGITEEEYDALKKNKPEMAILVAFNPKDKTPDGKLEILENGANLIKDGLIKITREIGIKKILLDTAALAPGENTGAAIASIPLFKEEFGLPTGCAIHNVVEKSKWLSKYNSRSIVDYSSNINITVFGGDYSIIGPIENAEFVLPLIAWEDILVSEYSENYFGIKPYKTHPRRKNK
jgi:tetrahydromethanopterin S-methyltransferase subunit H